MIGDVQLGAGGSVWFNAVIRGDVDSIRIGGRTNAQDGAILHVAHRSHAPEIAATSRRYGELGESYRSVFGPGAELVR